MIKSQLVDMNLDTICANRPNMSTLIKRLVLINQTTIFCLIFSLIIEYRIELHRHTHTDISNWLGLHIVEIVLKL